jgi:peptide/nickel transport system substrate-binding protein
VIAAVGEPESVIPPLAVETVARDIGDLVYERLADLEPAASPLDSAAYRPALASSWERMDSLTWRFRLRPAATWSDGTPVTAEDVVFSFAAFADSALGSPAQSYLAGLRVEADQPGSIRIHFPTAHPEQLYDATYHVRIMPRHVWAGLPRARWGSDTGVEHLVGSGPFRVAEWRRGQFLRLRRRGDAAAPASDSLRAIREVIWRFGSDPEAALNLVLSHDADLMELAATPEGSERVAADTGFEVVRYPSAAYGFLGFNLFEPGGSNPHPVLDRATRRALARAVDRHAIARAVFGPTAVAPPGPMSRLLWIWDDAVHPLAFDTAAAARDLAAAGWHPTGEGVRRRNGRALAFDLLVPSTSTTRRQLALALQEAWRRVGVRVSVSAVDFPVFQERLGARKFDAYIGAWLDEPSARGIADQWTRAGWDALNYGRYASRAFDSLFRRATAERRPAAARRLYTEAMDTLNADAPAIFLYNPGNAAAVSHRLDGVTINPYSWLSGLPGWRLRRGPRESRQ